MFLEAPPGFEPGMEVLQNVFGHRGYERIIAFAKEFAILDAAECC
jgi:hypothetical protein